MLLNDPKNLSSSAVWSILDAGTLIDNIDTFLWALSEANPHVLIFFHIEGFSSILKSTCTVVSERPN